jgi:hypothetical protein
MAKKKNYTNIYYAIGAVVLIIVIILLIRGVGKEAPEGPEGEEVVTPEEGEEEEVEEVPTEQEEIISGTPSAGEGEFEGGYCGDEVCANAEAKYPGEDVKCDISANRCTVGGAYTENAFICPSDCGIDCAEDITLGYRPGTCVITTEGDAELEIVSSGHGDVDGGLIFFVQAETGEVGFDSSTQVLKSGDTYKFTVEISDWEGMYGDLKQIQVLPRIVEDGETKACSNKKLSLPITSCS